LISPLLLPLLLLLLLLGAAEPLGSTTTFSRSEAKTLDPDDDLAGFGARVAAATSACAILNVSCGILRPCRFFLASPAGPPPLLLLLLLPASVPAGLLLLEAAADVGESCCSAAAWKHACLSVMYSLPSKVICRAPDNGSGKRSEHQSM
jgi:hypothetical protein